MLMLCLHHGAQREAQEEAQRMKLCRKLMLRGPSCVCAALGSHVLGTVLGSASFLRLFCLYARCRSALPSYVSLEPAL